MNEIGQCRPGSAHRSERVWTTAGAISALIVLLTSCGGAVTAADSGTAWSKPKQIEPSSSPSSRTSVYSVSCPATEFCVAVDEIGSVLVRNRGVWSTPEPIANGNSFASVSCPTTTFCAALTDGGDAATFDGASWSQPVNVGPAAGGYAVSCPSVSFCAAVNGNGVATTFDGRSWSSASTIDAVAGSDRVLDVSCPSARFCVAVDSKGNAETYA
jgi:hypothetical protein